MKWILGLLAVYLFVTRTNAGQALEAKFVPNLSGNWPSTPTSLRDSGGVMVSNPPPRMAKNWGIEAPPPPPDEIDLSGTNSGGVSGLSRPERPRRP